MVTKRADFLLNNLNNRIDKLDTDKEKRLEEKKQKEQQRALEANAKSKLERDEQLFMRMSNAREERQDKEKLRQRKYTPLQRQMIHGRGRQREHSYV